MAAESLETMINYDDIEPDYPKLITDRLLMRKLSHDDAPLLLKMRTSSTVNKYLDRPTPRDIDEIMVFINKIEESCSQKQLYYWAICKKEEPEKTYWYNLSLEFFKR